MYNVNNVDNDIIGANGNSKLAESFLSGFV
jgi:hypothetical protein